MSSMIPNKISVQYQAATTGCGYLDRSDYGKLALSGSEAKQYLNGQVTNDIEALAQGEGCYCAFLTNKGKMLGDLYVVDSGLELLLVTQRETLQPLFERIVKTMVGFDSHLHKRTLQRGLVTVVGAKAEVVLGLEDLAQTPYSSLQLVLDGIPLLAIRTELGIDLICDSKDTESLLKAVEERGGYPIEIETLELLRIEQGIPRYGADIDHNTIPQEAGINQRAVSFKKGCYVGQETVARLHYRGRPNRQLIGLELQIDPAEAIGLELHYNQKAVGKITSAVGSPRYGSIGLALLRREIQAGYPLLNSTGSVVATGCQLPFSESQPDA